MASNAPGQNATVEEILASIRQAISEDDARRTGGGDYPATRSDRPTVVSVGRILGEIDGEAEEVAEASESEPMDETDPSAGEIVGDDVEASVDQGVIDLAIEQALDGVRAELEGRRVPQSKLRPRQELVRTQQPRAIPRAPRLAPPRREQPARRPLLSGRADAEVSASFDDLAKAMIEGNAPKLNAVVEDLLRPMLKTWLETNLPQMVERLVREEIERVSRGRR